MTRANPTNLVEGDSKPKRTLTLLRRLQKRLVVEASIDSDSTEFATMAELRRTLSEYERPQFTGNSSVCKPL